MAEGALAGVRVVELGGGIAAAFATRLLADLGADVVKVEPPGGDPLRRAEPVVRDVSGGEASALFEFLNWSKRSVELPPGSTEATELASTADIVVLEPGAYDPQSLRATNPRLVVVSVSAFGADGPYATWRDGELVLQAMGGLMQISGTVDREPLKGGLRQPFYWGGLNAAWAALAAYLGRLETGYGAYLDLSLRECVAAQLTYSQPYYAFAGLVQARRAAQPEPFSGDPFPIGDSFVALQISGLLGMQDYVELFDGDERLGGEEFATAELRTKNAAGLSAIMAEHLASSSPREFFVNASERGFLAAFSQDAASLLSCPQLEARGIWHEFPHMPGIRFPAGLAELSRTPALTPRRAPRAGAHTQAILAERRAVAPAGAPADRRGPLQGLRVLDLSSVLAVPYLGAMLADLGAEVIKVEAPHRLDQMRAGFAVSFDNDPADEYWDRSMSFQALNRGKQSLSLDLGTDEGRDVLLRLVAVSDVLLENFTPRVMRKWGLTYDELVAINPRLVMLSNTGYGSTGPWSQFKAQGTTLETTMGLPEASGYVGGRPTKIGISYVDFLACWSGLAALLAALVERRSSGRGQWIDVGMYQLGLSVMPESLLHRQVSGGELARRGNADTDAVFSAVVAAAGEDRWLAVAAADESELAALERLVGGLDGLADWARAREPLVAAAELQEAGVAAGPILDARDLLHDPQLRQRGFHEWADYGEELGVRPLLGRPFTWESDATEVGIAGPAPRFGQDNERVLRDVVGLDTSAIERLYEQGVVTHTPVELRVVRPLDLDLMLESGQIAVVDRDYREVIAEAAAAAAESGVRS